MRSYLEWKDAYKLEEFREIEEWLRSYTLDEHDNLVPIEQEGTLPGKEACDGNQHSRRVDDALRHHKA
jgi:hypothetical protein